MFSNLELVVKLVKRGSVINRDTTPSSNIRVDFDGRGGEGAGLDPAPAHGPATAHATATVHNTIHCQPTQGKALPSRVFGEPAASSSHPSGTRLYIFFLLLLFIHIFESFTDIVWKIGKITCHVLSMSMKY